MPLYEEDMDNICEGCMTRNTGENFSHAGFCKSCMAQMMVSDSEEILKGKDYLTDSLAKNADEKTGALTSWRDTDGVEVEIMLPLPPGVTKKDLRVKVSPTKLLVASEERQLLFIDPLYDEVVPDEMVWCIEPTAARSADGSVGHLMQISLSKLHPGTRWGKTLSKDGGTFECWKSALLEAPKPEGAAPADAEASAAPSKKPRFTLRDDGEQVEVNLPLPESVASKKELKVTATPSKLLVLAGEKKLLHAEPLYAEIVPDELVWTLEVGKDGGRHVQLTLAKADESIEWLTNLVQEGGTFTCWTAEPQKS